MRGHSILYCVLVCSGWAFDCAHAQNGYSFDRADESKAAYSDPQFGAVGVCAEFRSRTTTDVAVIAAETLPASGEVPAHCRIDAMIPPEVRIQVNLPLEWNGRIYMHGNGGYAGTPPDAERNAADRDRALAKHFATAYTDTGHDVRVEPLATFAFNSPQKEIDYAFRAVHLTIALAKRLAVVFYGRPADYAYWDGCSTGGRQGLMSAQRFPADFDGIVAGAPVLDLSGTQTWGVWNGRALTGPGLTPAHVELIADAVYAKCDGLDGLEDGLIRDPRACDFEPARDLPRCEGQAGGACLTEAQIGALEKIYGGVVSNGNIVFPGLPVGAERGGWEPWLLNPGGESVQYVFGTTFMRYIAFPVDDADFDGADLDFDRDVERMAAAARLMNADDPDMRRFRDRGGKIIGYFGWADAALNPQMGVDYYESVMAEMGAEVTRDFYRLYMVPGMFHCRGGLGVDRIDAMTPLIDWVERGIVPQRLLGERVEEGEIVRSRPVCPYPEHAVYDGQGDPDAASSFSCGPR